MHDIGCGPGPILTRLIAEHEPSLPPTASLDASDFAPSKLQQVRAASAEALERDPESVWERVRVLMRDAMDLEGVQEGSPSHVTAGWVYFMTADPMECLREAYWVLKSGGVLGCTSWKRTQWMDVMELVSGVRSDAALPGLPGEWADGERLKGELEKAGFRDVEAVEVEAEMCFDTFDATVEMLMTKLSHIVLITRDWGEEEKDRLRRAMVEGVRQAAGGQEPGRLTGTALVAVGRK